MIFKKLDDLYFSQSSLSIFQKCRRRFRYRYLDGLYWPSEWGMNEKLKEDLQQGRLFHLLAERYYSSALGSTVLEKNSKLKAWLNRLKKIFPADDAVISAEQELRFRNGNLRLLAKYDLLKYDKKSNEYLIFDWKTDKKSLYSKELDDSIQSRFYLYLMAEAGREYFDYHSREFSMPKLIYWNPRYPNQKAAVKYSEIDLKRDRNFFENLIEEIYSEEDFALTDDLNLCRYCEYRPICRGKKQEGQDLIEEDLELDLDWGAVEEMEF